MVTQIKPAQGAVAEQDQVTQEIARRVDEVSRGTPKSRRTSSV
jgi:hypothetical protein